MFFQCNFETGWNRKGGTFHDTVNDTVNDNVHDTMHDAVHDNVHDTVQEGAAKKTMLLIVDWNKVGQLIEDWPLSE